MVAGTAATSTSGGAAGDGQRARTAQIAVEFGPAEIIDSLAMRPAAYYLAPALTGNMAAGVVLGKVLADTGFYACTIFSYEKFRTLVAVRDPSLEVAADTLEEREGKRRWTRATR